MYQVWNKYSLVSYKKRTDNECYFATNIFLNGMISTLEIELLFLKDILSF